jgi:hypothetical protein
VITYGKARVFLDGKEIPFYTEVSYGDNYQVPPENISTFTKEEYKAWKEKFLPKSPDEEAARLVPDVDPKKKLEDEGTR